MTPLPPLPEETGRIDKDGDFHAFRVKLGAKLYTAEQMHAYAQEYAALCVAAEREACAALCEATKVNKSPDYAPGNYHDGGCANCANAIRERKP